MAKLGESGGLLTWMNYARYPLFSIALGLLGFIIGFAFASIVGAFSGAIAGIVLGVLGGLAMGRNESMFPVVLEKWAAYGGGAPSYEGKYPARVVTQVFNDAKGGFVERRIVEYLQGTTLRQLSNFSLPVWFTVGETRKLMVLQVDTFTFLPITWEKGILVARDVPLYSGHDEKNEQGETVFIYDRDDKGNAIESGKRKVELINTNVMIEDNKLVQIPKGLAAKMDNERVQYTLNNRIANEFNTTMSFWDKWGPSFLAIISVLAILVIAIYAVIKFGEAGTSIGQAIANAENSASQNNLVTAHLNAQLAQFMIQNGFHYNQTFDILATPTPTPPPVGFKIPGIQ